VTSRHSRLRTSDVARGAGYSVQQIRNLERDGVIPPASRSDTGYRIYGEEHLESARAYQALAAAVGPVEAKAIVRATHAYPASDLLALLDAAHARLHTERRDLALAQDAAAAISTEPIDDVRASDAMSIAELAGALGCGSRRCGTGRRKVSSYRTGPGRAACAATPPPTCGTRASSISCASPDTASRSCGRCCLGCGPPAAAPS